MLNTFFPFFINLFFFGGISLGESSSIVGVRLQVFIDLFGIDFQVFRFNGIFDRWNKKRTSMLALIISQSFKSAQWHREGGRSECVCATDTREIFRIKCKHTVNANYATAESKIIRQAHDEIEELKTNEKVKEKKEEEACVSGKKKEIRLRQIDHTRAHHKRYGMASIWWFSYLSFARNPNAKMST